MSIRHDLILSRRPAAALVAVGMAWGSFSALVPPIKAQIGASDGLYGGLVLIASFGALGAMWLAPLAVHLTGRAAVPLGAVAIAVGFGLAGMSPGPVWFALALLLAAAGSGVADVLANAEIADAEAETGRALMSLNHASYSFAFAGAAMVAGVARTSGASPGAILWGLAVAIAVLCLFTRGGAATAPATSDEDAQGLPMSLIWLGGGVVLAAFTAEASTEGWAALHVERTLGGDAAAGAAGPAFFGLAMGIGRIFGHGLSQRLSDVRLMGAGCVLAGCGIALAAAALGPGLALGGFALAGLGISVVVPLALGRVGRLAPPGRRLAAISRASVLGYGAFFLGPPLMGGLAELFGLRAGFGVIAAAIALTGVVLVPALGRLGSARPPADRPVPAARWGRRP